MGKEVMVMHEGKHGILDGLDDLDDLFGKEDKETDKENHKHGDHKHGDHKHDNHKHDEHK